MALKYHSMHPTPEGDYLPVWLGGSSTEVMLTQEIKLEEGRPEEVCLPLGDWFIDCYFVAV